MNKLKWMSLAAILVFSLIVIFQNLASIEFRVLFMTFQLPQAALLLITLGIGYSLGLSTPTVWRMAAWRAKSKKARIFPAERNKPEIPQSSV